MTIPVLLIILAILMLGAGLLVVFGMQTTKSRAATAEMEDRLERYGHVTDTVIAPESEPRARTVMANKMEEAVGGRSSSQETRDALARADLRMTVGEWILVRLGSAAGFSVLGLIMGRFSLAVAIVLGVVTAGIGWMVPHFYLKLRASRRQNAFNAQLGDTISLMANSLRAGYSLLQTMDLVGKESPPPISDEFRRVVREVGLGISPQQALDNLYRRVPSEDLDLLITAIKIQSEVGGNLGEILDVIGETIRERVRIKGEIRTLTAQQTISAYVLSGLPLVLGAGLFVMNPSYMAGMFVWPWVCMPIAAGFLMIVGFLVMRKIVSIKI
ncbi:MAG: type II secretion system F family protein [Thermomicrobiales bacterium]